MADAFQPKFVDLVRNYTTTMGTDDFVLGPAVNGFASFTDACAVGDRFYYSALGIDNPAETEVGRGTLLAGGVIGRDPISGTKTNFKSGTKAVALVAAAEWFSALEAARASTGATNVKSFGCKGDGTTDDTAAIQAALDHLAAVGGGALYFPEGDYLVSASLTVPARATIRGAGRVSTRIVSAHAGGGGATAGESLRNGSGLVTSSPINGSTGIYFLLEDIAVVNRNPANVGAAYYDSGGTFIACRNVGFSGFKYGVVLEQSELADFDLCEFDGQNAGGAGLWIVNGDDLTPGASAGFSNRIAIKRCQFNESGAAYGVVDDGGNSHVLEDNNYNGCLNHVRAAGVFPLDVRGGEFESAAGHCIVIDSLTVNGASAGGCYTAVRGGTFAATAGNSAIHGQNSAGLLQVDGLPLLAGGAGTPAITGSSAFAGLWLMSYSNQTLAPEIKDGNATYVNLDMGFGRINGVTCQDGIVTAANIGSAAAHDEQDFLHAANNLQDVGDPLAAARNLGGAIVLGQGAGPVSHTGDTNEATLATIIVPANAMGVNGRIRIEADFSFTSSANAKTLKAKFGGVTLLSVAPTAAGFDLIEARVTNRDSSNSQRWAAKRINGSTATTTNAGTAAVDTTQDVTVAITGQLASASDTVTLESFQVVLYPGDAA